MIKQLRNTFFVRFFWGLVAIYLLNISVDAPESEFSINQSFFNEQESIVEIVVEQVLGFEEAIDEHDEKKSEDHNQKKNSRLDIDIQYFTNAIFRSNFHLIKSNNFKDFSDKLCRGFHKKLTPPPKV